MKRHAYLIIANKNFDQLQILLELLDNEQNDIYLLIDKKSSNIPDSFSVINSNLFVLPQIPIYWGEYSQVQAEINLLKESTKYHYQYFHLISGQDLPIVSQGKIHDFFDKHPNKIFLTYSKNSSEKKLDERSKTHLFRKHYRVAEYTGFKQTLLKTYRKLERLFLFFQKPKYKINNHVSTWFSIDEETANLIVSNEDWIFRNFSTGYLVDEIFIPALIDKYQLHHKVYDATPVQDKPEEFQGNLRYINWWDGQPYIWTIDDVDQIKFGKEIGHLFSRKFDISRDIEIIDYIYRDISEK
ncbi:beta-1,6-N-acetylglucosaminyltransferase [Enterococcus asini]|uniref:beta-1,6-N-acetylglucosaminyltransferase n=1 Tax=Enterococcus asini TaxID=57732 RepID=UPI0032E4561C